MKERTLGQWQEWIDCASNGISALRPKGRVPTHTEWSDCPVLDKGTLQGLRALKGVPNVEERILKAGLNLDCVAFHMVGAIILPKRREAFERNRRAIISMMEDPENRSYIRKSIDRTIKLIKTIPQIREWVVETKREEVRFVKNEAGEFTSQVQPVDDRFRNSIDGLKKIKPFLERIRRDVSGTIGSTVRLPRTNPTEAKVRLIRMLTALFVTNSKRKHCGLTAEIVGACLGEYISEDAVRDVILRREGKKVARTKKK